jgi:hypothetical protein
MEKTTVKVQNADITGPLWIIGWLFTLGFLQLTFWKGVLALLIWPYYIGEYLTRMGPPPPPIG